MLDSVDKQFGCLFAIILAVLIVFGVLAYREHTAHVNGIHQGAVVEKKHQDAWTQWIYISHGKYGGHMQPIFHPESWSVVIDHEDETNEFSLNVVEWMSVQDGDWLIFEGDTLRHNSKSKSNENHG